ncbi:MAG: ATP-binding protein, partial [Candidatus Dormibacteraeota bacterium]|nr:ATP-binding protein [Candidatus Dormibacteraeota bacterium]
MVRGPAGSATSLLLEREPELARIDQLIAATTAGAGHVVVFEGRPGIGKTALLTELRIRAQAAGMAAYSARASELEGEFAFGVVRQLFEPVVRSLSQDESSRLLAGAAALAAPVLGLEGERVTGGPFAALHGLYWLAADLSARGPLLLAVDDAHWAD